MGRVAALLLNTVSSEEDLYVFAIDALLSFFTEREVFNVAPAL